MEDLAMLGVVFGLVLLTWYFKKLLEKL